MTILCTNLFMGESFVLDGLIARVNMKDIQESETNLRFFNS